MYDLADVLPDAELDPGTNLLITGPPMAGKRRLALDILAHGTEQEQGSIVVTTKDGGDKILDEYAKRIEDIDGLPVGVVDCVTKQRGVSNVEDSPQLKYASSPVDMTGIGIKLSEFLQEFYERRGLAQNRVLLHSVSTLLMYSDLQTVFRFLHVFTGRVQSADALGLYVIDSTAHDDQTMNTLKQLFDGVIEVGEDEADAPTLKIA
ncbi:RecA-superfamily ATPase, KaiC/GvpD/RAD55 family [Natronoarchaeum philippinense]|uniref:RecA-superfamily ATPase, KaiC/GvpD/RAD55 family n=1 Tax=Natronoarchaeum philippinense TaxID=558529 RepID=A0A285N1Z9_NATPI|nr:recombinase RecA [Natronoarchaeum philippinense]SNZ03494.1 RecA-superfamily ATPase, KaiC/GvpD/RAD55 family [Natronoarchaeum philippinense]